MKEETFKVILKTTKDQETPDEKGNFFKMHKTYTVPLPRLSEMISYLEQFKPKKS